ncbi:unnamed protein product [Nesidiocoris tenuis]|uniref:Uncharacterized protein n=2 Tax=Nesidiocoris tenuis TaxID=355587 RepID=A0A6H5GS17_9HEMI|nr:unnamed protein product [Nesidiocoris tenuis]
MGKRRRASSSDSSVSDSPARHKRRGGKKKLKKRVKRLEAILARLATHSTTESDRGNPRKSPTSVDIDHKNQSGSDSEIDLTFEDNLSDSGSSARSQNRQADQPVVSQGNNSPHKNDSVPHEVTSHGNTHSLPSVSHEPCSHKGTVDPANQPTGTLPPDIAEILGENEPHPVNTDRSLHPLILNPAIRSLASNVKPTSMLYGDNLSEVIKSARSVEGVANELRAKPGPSSSHAHGTSQFKKGKGENYPSRSQGNSKRLARPKGTAIAGRGAQPLQNHRDNHYYPPRRGPTRRPKN